MPQQEQVKPRPTVPREYGGKWIAWNEAGTKIIAEGASLKEAQAAALTTGEKDPGFEWVPPANFRIVGDIQ